MNTVSILDANAQYYAIVDEIDYQWAIEYRWNIKRCKRLKEYARRAISTYHDDGSRKGSQSVYLHIEIMKRTGKQQPTVFHKIVDHRNGNSLDCRRYNLRWATPRMNNMNIRGQMAYDLVED
jgi:HNH endonuclease